MLRKKNTTLKALILSMVLALSGCELLQEAATDTLNDDAVLAYVIGAPYGNGEGGTPNGYVGTISEGTTENYTVNTTYTEIAKTANAAKVKGNDLYVLHSGSNSLMKIDLSTNEKEEMSLGTNQNPFDFAIVDGKAFVTNLIAHTVSVVDLTTMTLIETIELPSGNALSPPSGSVTYAYPQAILYIDGYLYVSLTNQDSTREPVGPSLIAKINPTTYQVDGLIGPLSGTNAVSLAYDELYPTILFVAQPGDTWPADNLAIIEAIDLETELAVASINVSSDSERMAVTPEGNLYVTSSYNGSSIFDLSFSNQSFALEDTISLSNGLSATFIAFDSSGRLFVIDYSGNQVFIREPNATDFSAVDVNDQPTVIAF